jgi:hypothetical protein
MTFFDWAFSTLVVATLTVCALRLGSYWCRLLRIPPFPARREP